mmetsp:Transcript_25068/g.48783  ORF Transcript_25068/g.48783 Transcript_25068/m.48783 type:complete len:412 (-) Transcript_25068:759-1994(-)
MISSSEKVRGGGRLILSSDPAARMLVSCLASMGFTSRSLSRECSPMIMPGYTSTPDPTKSSPRACSFPSEYNEVSPERMETSTPLRMFSRSPLYGSNPLKARVRMPDPLVSVKKMERYPSRPRVGTSRVMRVRPFSADGRMSVMTPLRSESLAMTGPENSSSTSTTTSSMGSNLLPFESFWKRTRGGQTPISNPSRRMFSSRIPSCSSPRPMTSYASLRSSEGLTVMPMLFSHSVKRRSLIICDVSLVLFLSLPARGESLGQNVMHSVGGSIAGASSASVTSMPAMVCPTVALARPQTCTMSPARADCISTLPVPLRAMILEQRPLSSFLLDWSMHWIVSPCLTSPDVMRPVQMRPRKESYSIIVTTIENSGRSSTVGLGMVWTTQSRRSFMLSVGLPGHSVVAKPLRPEA